MKKFLSFILSIGVFLFFTPITTEAMTVSPNSGSFSPGAEQTIAVLAAPPDGEVSAIQLRLRLENASIVPSSVSTSMAEDNGYLIIGTCEGQKKYTNNEICVDFAKSEGKVNTGDLLLQFKIKFNGTEGTSYIFPAIGNAYVSGSQIVLQEDNTLGTYSVVSNHTPTPTQLPVAGIEDYPGVVLGLGLLTVMLGVGFFIWRNKAQAVT